MKDNHEKFLYQLQHGKCIFKTHLSSNISVVHIVTVLIKVTVTNETFQSKTFEINLNNYFSLDWKLFILNKLFATNNAATRRTKTNFMLSTNFFKNFSLNKISS